MKNKVNSILIIANGAAPKKQLLQSLVKKSDCIIAADGGANICYKNKIYPDCVIGDFDSITNKVKNYFKDSEFIHRPGQDEHDLLKALKFCDTLKPEKVITTAVFGKRIDHTLSNLFFLQNQRFGFPVEFIDDFGKTILISKKYEFNLPQNHSISFLSYKAVFGITLTGFKYNLKNKDYPDGFNGASNQIVENPACVNIKQGSLITVIPHA